MARTLVITLGQLRGGSLTWGSFKKFVLDELDADLAVCVPNDSFFSISNVYFKNSKYKWLAPDYEDYGDAFDIVKDLIGSQENWRILCQVGGSWLGRVKEANNSGAASILFFLRWYMLENIKSLKLTEEYDRFIITRSDYFYTCPHPSAEVLSSQYVWIPNGEDYGGYTDRHIVVSSDDVFKCCNIIDDLLNSPSKVYEEIKHIHQMGIEYYIGLHFDKRNLTQRVRRFPFVMYLVRDAGDPSSWAQGSFDSSVGMTTKYPLEVMSAKGFESIIKHASDWQKFFSLQDLISTHGTNDWLALMRSLDFEKIFERGLTIDIFRKLYLRRLEGIPFDEEDIFIINLLGKAENSNSQLFQDLWVIYETNKSSGFFIDIGAGNGKKINNSFILEKQFNWDGIVSEANADYHIDLESNRSCRINRDYITGSYSGQIAFRKTDDPIYSTNQELLGFIPEDKHTGKDIVVQSKPIMEMLEENCTPHLIDFMSIDTNGNEFDIIQSFDFKKYIVNCVCINHNFSESRDRIRNLMIKNGYKRKFSSISMWDDWYIK